MVLGHADARRDWGFTGDYVKAMCPVVQADTHEDLVIATGATRSMRGSCDEASTCVGLNSRRCVKPDRELLRPSISQKLLATPAGLESFWAGRLGSLFPSWCA